MIQDDGRDIRRLFWDIEPFYRVHYCDGEVSVQSFSKHKKGRFLSIFNSGGYDAVKMNNKGTFIHSLVCEHFFGPRPHKLVTNHKDGNKTNNRIDNLEYVTIAENIRHAIEVIGTHVSCDPTRMPKYKDGRCKDKAKYKHDWYMENREMCLKREAERYANNREFYIEKQKRYYHAKKEAQQGV